MGARAEYWSDRRERIRQREAIDELLPHDGPISLLRLASGEVLVYDEIDDKRRPVSLRAAVLPDGDTVEFEQTRFPRN